MCNGGHRNYPPYHRRALRLHSGDNPEQESFGRYQCQSVSPQNASRTMGGAAKCCTYMALAAFMTYNAL